MSTAASAPKATYLPDETAAQLLRRTRCPPLPTRVALIDELRVGDAVELFGASGSGKTEMLYHIILACIMPKEYQGFDLQGASSKALVLDLDCRFNLSRLSTILESRIFALMKAQRPDFDGDAFFKSDAAILLMTSILDRLLIMRCPSATGADFMSALKYLPTLCSIESRDDATPLRLLIVDNIGANYWVHKTQPDGMKWYDTLAAELKRLISTHNLSLILTKPQIFSRQGRGDDSWYLGSSIQNLCRVRLHLTNLNQTVLVDDSAEGAWSASLMSRDANNAFLFTIVRRGVIALEHQP